MTCFLSLAKARFVVVVAPAALPVANDAAFSSASLPSKQQ